MQTAQSLGLPYLSAYHPAGQVIYIHFFHQVIVIHGGSRDIVAFVRTYVIKAEIIGKPILSVPGNDAASLDTDDQASVFHINSGMTVVVDNVF